MSLVKGIKPHYHGRRIIKERWLDESMKYFMKLLRKYRNLYPIPEYSELGHAWKCFFFFLYQNNFKRAELSPFIFSFYLLIILVVIAVVIAIIPI